MIFSPDTLIQDIKRIQPAYQKRLLKLGIKTLKDLFYHFPHRYDDFSKITPIGELKLGDTATVQGRIIDIKNIRTWRKKIFVTEAYVQDESGIIKTVWFNQPFIADTLKQNSLVSISGKVNFDKTLYLSNPAYEKILVMERVRSGPERRLARRAKQGAGLEWVAESEGPAERAPLVNLRHTGRLVPVYPETAGLSSRYLRYLIQIFLPTVLKISDWLPQEIKIAQQVPDLATALKQVHFPDSQKYLEAAKRRLAFDELFLIQLFTLQQKIQWQKEHSLKIDFEQTLIKNFVAQLPFKLTNAQRQAAWEVLQDLNKTKPMNRLLEGDVGSGKTVVAAIAALQTVRAGWQVAFMAPTEILAQQHWQTITKLFKNYTFKIGLLTSSENKSSYKLQVTSYKKSELIKKIGLGEVNIIIGTHALIQKGVKFKNLALVIVDEQHRFGVEQRAVLQKNVLKIEDGLKISVPHLLSMTATPIPRTLALTIYGDLDISVLDEMPLGRQKIVTKIITPANRQKTYEFIRQEIKKDRQIFVICPRIEIANGEGLGQVVSEDRPASPKLQRGERERSEQGWSGWSKANHLPKPLGQGWDEIKAVKKEYKKLSEKIFPDFKIAMLHGKMKSKEKNHVMQNFKSDQTDILVSTSVVEVGIDIPNATVMMIEGAERFGLAQLHQFRGRVGRGSHQSYCFLFTESSSSKTNQRLKAMISAKSGFELAEKDLEIRGPGEFFGTRQSGLPDLSMASLADIDLIKQVRAEAIKILQKDPSLKNYPMLVEKLNSFQKTIHLE